MSDLNQYLRFTKKTIPIPADYRPLYKIGHILLSLHICSRGGKASLMKLHFLSWAIKSRRNIEIVRGWVKDNFNNDFHIWGIEPTVNRALMLATADQLISIDNAHYKIAPKGNQYMKLILKDESIYIEEKKFLEELGKSTITEAKIELLSRKLL